MSQQNENINLNIQVFLFLFFGGNIWNFRLFLYLIKVNFFCRKFLLYSFKFVGLGRRPQTILVILSPSNMQKNHILGLHFLVPNIFLLNQLDVDRQFKQIDSWPYIGKCRHGSLYSKAPSSFHLNFPLLGDRMHCSPLFLLLFSAKQSSQYNEKESFEQPKIGTEPGIGNILASVSLWFPLVLSTVVR